MGRLRVAEVEFVVFVVESGNILIEVSTAELDVEQEAWRSLGMIKARSRRNCSGKS